MLQAILLGFKMEQRLENFSTELQRKVRALEFPAGISSTIGVGGHFSGGGYGYLMRKYGLAADNIVDAHLIDINGRILDRTSMGKTCFGGSEVLAETASEWLLPGNLIWFKFLKPLLFSLSQKHWTEMRL